MADPWRIAGSLETAPNADARGQAAAQRGQYVTRDEMVELMRQLTGGDTRVQPSATPMTTGYGTRGQKNHPMASFVPAPAYKEARIEERRRANNMLRNRGSYNPDGERWKERARARNAERQAAREAVVPYRGYNPDQVGPQVAELLRQEAFDAKQRGIARGEQQLRDLLESGYREAVAPTEGPPSGQLVDKYEALQRKADQEIDTQTSSAQQTVTRDAGVEKFLREFVAGQYGRGAPERVPPGGGTPQGGTPKGGPRQQVGQGQGPLPNYSGDPVRQPSGYRKWLRHVWGPARRQQLRQEGLRDDDARQQVQVEMDQKMADAAAQTEPADVTPPGHPYWGEDTRYWGRDSSMVGTPE